MTIKLHHQVGNFGTQVFTRGTDEVLDFSIFEYED